MVAITPVADVLQIMFLCQDKSATRPSFVLNREEFEVLFRNVQKEDEGVYEVEVTEADGKVNKFNYVLVVLGNATYICIRERQICTDTT